MSYKINLRNVADVFEAKELMMARDRLDNAPCVYRNIADWRMYSGMICDVVGIDTMALEDAESALNDSYSFQEGCDPEPVDENQVEFIKTYIRARTMVENDPRLADATVIVSVYGDSFHLYLDPAEALHSYAREFEGQFEWPDDDDHDELPAQPEDVSPFVLADTYTKAEAEVARYKMIAAIRSGQLGRDAGPKLTAAIKRRTVSA